jgi:hypothetical protein
MAPEKPEPVVPDPEDFAEIARNYPDHCKSDAEKYQTSGSLITTTLGFP